MSFAARFSILAVQIKSICQSKACKNQKQKQKIKKQTNKKLNIKKLLKKKIACTILPRQVCKLYLPTLSEFENPAQYLISSWDN